MADGARIAHVAIVGGGITGLAAAHAARVRARELGRPLTVTVLERASRFGGSLITDRVDDFLLDGGPDSWVAAKPHATELARALGLGGSLIGTNESTRRYYVAWGGRLHVVPEGLVLGVPTQVVPLALASLFSLRGKVRMALEPFVATRRFDGDDDESIADFAARRLGREAAERLVAPLLGGISAGDAGTLSIRAAFPQLVTMEREYGSLVLGMRAGARGRRSVSRADGTSPFVSLDRGVGALVDALREQLTEDGVRLRGGTSVTAIALGRRGWTLTLGGEERLEADALVLAVPAHVAARLLGAVDEAASRALATVRHASTATVFLAYRTSELDHPLDGVGFIVPRAPGRTLLAATWVSSKWAHRAPPGHALVRAFFGGASNEGTLARDDGALTELARKELRVIMGLGARPQWSRVYRFDRATPQMRVGHLVTMRTVRERLARLAPSVRVAGGGYDGVGISDCIRQGQEAARALVEAVANVEAAAQSPLARDP
jgi:oxygen-dependent protoporphyrinogen oxidase